MCKPYIYILFYLKILRDRLADTKLTRATLAAITDLLKKIVKSSCEFAIINIKIELMANYFGISKADLVEEYTDKPTSNEFPTDPDIRRIQRAREKMFEQEKSKMMKILEASFDDYFGDDFIDEDND